MCYCPPPPRRAPHDICCAATYLVVYRPRVPVGDPQHPPQRFPPLCTSHLGWGQSAKENRRSGGERAQGSMVRLERDPDVPGMEQKKNSARDRVRRILSRTPRDG